MNKVIYIEDQEDARITYSRSLKRIYGDEFEIIAIEPSNKIEEMVETLLSYDDVVSYIIDERLNLTGVANYIGTTLVEAIRAIDSKIPVYILTSYAGDVDPILGSVEFVIDKSDAFKKDKRHELSQRMRRHIDTFNDIQSARAKRLDELLIKSVEHNLSEKEQKELEKLNYFRMKKILLEEQAPSIILKGELDKQAEILREIEEKLKELD
ncbi:hypothetical protein [Photobacterium lipolyticum]|uniref:Response regulatory domain-containing protein n=1 Tax=Photobacterium lipolyticum TaxID=266810 RepID=A0A2T3N0I5_9GAMM|nr:hypothetical protein [Photobacterium lipolyticum]PSW05666.1 hypothetical protein C9I89_07915 [Photobacterium lipolyticum]